MNLADAIRSAANAGRQPATPTTTAATQSPATPAGEQELKTQAAIAPEPSSPSPTVPTVAHQVPEQPTEPATPEQTPGPAPANHTASADELDHVAQLPEHSISAQGNMVRLELVLTPEQMNGILRSLIEGHRSILTSREAVAYLRIPQGRLEEMAERGELPSFKLGGRWRFPKPALDEWLMAQTYHHGDHHDVA